MRRVVSALLNRNLAQRVGRPRHYRVNLTRLGRRIITQLSELRT